MTAKEFLEGKKSEIIELQTLLTNYPAIAPEGGGDGEAEKAAALEKWLVSKGFEHLKRYEIPDSRVSAGFRPSLEVTIPGKKDDFCVWVIAHIDVVPVGDENLWQTNPWKVVEKDGRLFGRGVEDNQQGLCSAVFASLYYIENKIVPEHTVKLLFAADEENGSLYGTIPLVKKGIFGKKDLVLIPDGGDPKGQTIEIAEKNLLWLQITVEGKQTHGSRPDSGANACLAASDLAVRLNNLEKVFDKKDDLFEPAYSTFQPTKRFSNVDSINIIPGKDVFCMDCRILPCYALKDVLTQVDEICRLVEKERNVRVSYETPQKSESPATKQTSIVAQKLAASIKKVHDIEPKFIGIGGGTVGAELRREGIDAVVWSTLDDQAHQPNEYCDIKNLCSDALTLIDFFGDGE